MLVRWAPLPCRNFLCLHLSFPTSESAGPIPCKFREGSAGDRRTPRELVARFRARDPGWRVLNKQQSTRGMITILQSFNAAAQPKKVYAVVALSGRMTAAVSWYGYLGSLQSKLQSGLQSTSCEQTCAAMESRNMCEGNLFSRCHFWKQNDSSALLFSCSPSYFDFQTISGSIWG